MWPLFKELEDPQLLELARYLPNTVLHSKASITAKKYLGAIRRWKQWASNHSIKPFPATSSNVALYLQHIGETSKSKAAVEEAVHAMVWLHNAAGVPSPTANPFVTLILEGLRNKKAPIVTEILSAMAKDTMENQTLTSVRLTSACLLAYAGFLRFNELHKLRPTDLTIDSEKLLIKIRQSKTDQFRKGDEVLIARTGSIMCPVAMLEKYLGSSYPMHNCYIVE